LLIAVADGVSASPRAEIGAQIAAAQGIALLRRHLDAGLSLPDLRTAELYEEIAQAMLAGARARKLTPADICSTLALLVVPAQGEGISPRKAWAAQIADTTVWRKEAAGEWVQLSGKAKASFDGNALPAVLPYHPDQATSRVLELPAAAALAVFTDGVSDALDEVEGACGWFSQRWATPPPLASFLLDIDFEAKGQHDDRTAVVIWCGSASTQGPT